MKHAYRRDDEGVGAALRAVGLRCTTPRLRVAGALRGQHGHLTVDAIYALGVHVGKALTTAERFGTVVGSCATDEDTGNDEACLDDFVTSFGERALRDIFGSVEASTTGEHTLTRRGFGLEPADDTKQYTWGDPFGLVDTNRTVLNAVMREGPPAPVRMHVDDFEVHPTLALTQCSTVIMLDMSYSMMHGGRFQAGRRIALALDTLIYGLLLILFIIYMPKGILGTLLEWREKKSPPPAKALSSEVGTGSR